MLAVVISGMAQDTRIDSGFALGTGPDAPVYAVAEAPDGRIWIGGMFSAVNGSIHHYVARLSRHGVVDESFNPQIGPDNLVDAVVPSPDETAMIGGYFIHYNNFVVNHLVRLGPDGNLSGIYDISSGPDYWVYSIVPASSDLFYIGGNFDSIAGQIRIGIALMSSLGQLSPFFAPEEQGGPVKAIAVRPNGKVLKGGEFGALSSNRRGISQLNIDGSIDQSFDPGRGVNGSVNAMALTTDGKVIIAGDFTQVNGVTQSNIARLRLDGKLDTTFATGLGANMKIRAMVVQSDGKILIGGDFRSFDGQGRACFARLRPDGSLDTSFNIGIIGFGAVLCLANQADGGVLIGGSFSSMAVNGRPYLVRLLPTDTDGDGMPDVWERAHGLDYTKRDDFLDADGDGSTNLQEYLAGTDPNDSRSSPKIRMRTNASSLELTILTVQGRRYQLQQVNSLANPMWYATGAAKSGDGQDAMFVIPMSQIGVGLFRIAISEE